MQDLLPGYNQKIRKDVIAALFAKTPTADIVEQIATEYGEQIEPEVIDRARLLARPAIDGYWADRHEIIFRNELERDAIDQSTIKVALDHQALMAWELGQDLHGEFLDLQTEPLQDKRKLKRSSIIEQLKDLSIAAGNITRAQVIIAEAKLKIPHLDKQINGKTETPRTEITAELITELERTLGVLPYDGEAETIAIDASAIQTTPEV